MEREGQPRDPGSAEGRTDSRYEEHFYNRRRSGEANLRRFEYTPSCVGVENRSAPQQPSATLLRSEAQSVLGHNMFLASGEILAIAASGATMRGRGCSSASTAIFRPT